MLYAVIENELYTSVLLRSGYRHCTPHTVFLMYKANITCARMTCISEMLGPQLVLKPKYFSLFLKSKTSDV